MTKDQDEYERMQYWFLMGLRHKEAGGVTEIRILGTKKGIVSGYYTADNFKKAVIDIRPFIGKGNIYATLNPVHPDILARAANRLQHYARVTTSDNEILGRHFIPIDIDPVRPANISATEREKNYALKKRDEVEKYIRKKIGDGHHWCGMSGNGTNILISTRLPNTEEVTMYLKNFLRDLSQKFSDPITDEIIPDPPLATIDTSVYNAAQLWKIPGTIAVKGDSVKSMGRVHRRATIEFCKIEPILKGAYDV